jgi:hypothetical protein
MLLSSSIGNRDLSKMPLFLSFQIFQQVAKHEQSLMAFCICGKMAQILIQKVYMLASADDTCGIHSKRATLHSKKRWLQVSITSI